MRSLRRRPGFTATVLLTLALGIGANTALFGVFRAVFLEPLPLPDPDELVLVMEAATFGCCGPASGPDYVDWRERQRTFDEMGALDPGPVTLTGLEEAERVHGVRVTASIFPLLGVEPLLGRALDSRDQVDGGVVVLSHGLWERTTGGRGDVVGTTLEVDGVPHTVVGVMPESFDVPSPWNRTQRHQLYLPFLSETLEQNRGNHSYPVLARLSDGVDMATAQSDMDRIMTQLAAEYPDTNGDRTARVFGVHQYLFAEMGRQLGLILGAGLLVLLIACGNVAALLLARAASRETELAVRSALGASRATVTRLLFTESLVLATLGGLLGVAVSFLFVDGLRSLLPANVPRIDAIRIDGTAFLFAGGAAAFTALAFGMLPSILAARGNLAARVREAGYGTLAPSRERARDWFIVGQIALGLVLANGAALLVRSYATLRAEDFGFRHEGVLTLALNPAGPRYEDGLALVTYYDQVLERTHAVPGVTGVGTVSRLPFFGGSNTNVLIEGRGPRSSADQGPLVEVASVSGDYFEVLGIPILAGRRLVPADSSTGAVGVVINQAMADEAWPGENPLGKRFSLRDDPPDWLTVVGVAGNVRAWGPESRMVGQAWLPFVHGWSTAAYLTVRASGDPAMVVPAVRQAILEVDPTQPASDVRTMESRVESRFAQRRFYTTLIGLFALSALLLAAAGIYGTVSYFVARRVRELGIRIALGAPRAGIVGLVVRRGVRVATWGVLLGLLGIWATTSIASGLVYGIAATDLLSILAGCIVLAGVAVLASALPASRAARVPPGTALRAE
jgi:putative ABC transport system permease protein